MRRNCWSVVLAGLLSLGMFGCALSTDAEPEDDGESAESALFEATAESDLGEPCPRWRCESVDPNGCEGFGFGASIGRCRVEARNNCTANCGPGCSLDDTPTCDSF